MESHDGFCLSSSFASHASSDSPLWCADGMLGYENALKITNTPFPFPFAQCVALLLHINAIVAPALLADWLRYSWLAGIVTFINVFVMYLLNEVSLTVLFARTLSSLRCLHMGSRTVQVAREIEEPFKFDPNDLPIANLHHKFNRRLVTALFKSLLPKEGMFHHICEEEMLFSMTKLRPSSIDLRGVDRALRVGTVGKGQVCHLDEDGASASDSSIDMTERTCQSCF